MNTPFLLSSYSILIWWGIPVLYFLSRRIRRHSILHLPGPKSNSWLVGNVPAFQRPDSAGEADFEWSAKYGLAFRTKGCFGENLLFLADPKALQYVLNRRGYNYPKTYESRILLQLTTGRGLAWAEGEQHARQRKIMNPAFSYSALKVFLPVFFEIAQKTTAAWKAVLNQHDHRSSIIDISPWLARTTLDIIGATALGHNFNTVKGDESELAKAYHNILTDTNYMPSNFTILFRRLIGYAPMWLSKYLLFLPKKDHQRPELLNTLVKNLGRELLAQQLEFRERGEEVGKDVMSTLIRANLSEDPKRRLGMNEVLDQIMTLIMAGHETTATTISWILYELSTHPEAQILLREEIRATREKVIARGGREMSITDLESMKLTVAVMKESLRFYPILPQASRMAAHDDVIPLARPQAMLSGRMVNAIPVSQGQIVTVSVCAYNRLKSVWGEDAGQWRPERFLEEFSNDHDHKINLGVVGNLATFGSGLRGCIGWRFSLLEMQAILIELIENFEFSPAPGNMKIKCAMAALIQPMVEGQESKGTQMPLTVTAINV